MRSRAFVGVALLLGLAGCTCQRQRHAASETTPSPSAAKAAVPKAPVTGRPRPARLAGAWYAADPAALRRELDGYLKAADTPAGDTFPAAHLLGVIVPHAGYRYSGPTAAFAYQRVGQAKPKRAFVIGPSHHKALRAVVVVEGAVFATPLGPLTIDQQAGETLLKDPLFIRDSAADAREHSVEMQMPFLRHVAPEIRVVPLIAGALTMHEVKRVATVLRRLLRPGDIVIASSDFTHYGSNFGYLPFTEDVPEKLKRLDLTAWKTIASGDIAAFWRFKHKTEDTICGVYPISILMATLGKPTAQAKLLDYQTSGELMDDYENSVSYIAASWGSEKGWAGQKNVATQDFLGAEDRRHAVAIARRTLETYFAANKRFDAQAAGLVSGRLKEQHGVFVTLKRKRDGSLRGIGHVVGRQPLYQGIVDNALNAALRDRRFRPVTAEELDTLAVEVTVLSPPQVVAGPSEITLGRDGIILSKDERQALFLPQVAIEQRWGLRRTLSALAQKAGLDPQDWQDATFKTFQGYVYDEPH